MKIVRSFVLLGVSSLEILRISAFGCTNLSHWCRKTITNSNEPTRTTFLSSSSSSSSSSSNNTNTNNNIDDEPSQTSTTESTTTTPTPSLTNENDEPGDKIRLENNIRPSLNPTVINTISNALLQRSTTKSSFIPTPDNTPITIMLEAASLASKAIQSRAKGSTQVKGDNGVFTEEESKLVAGRIVGVLMRLNELEDELIDRVNDVDWVRKYGEQGMFGVCKVELDDGYRPSSIGNVVSKSVPDNGNGNGGESEEAYKRINDVLEKLKDDPLVRMCRAECLYALFLKNIELPSMEKAGQIPVDGANAISGGIDFMDPEKMEVLFPQGFE